MIKFLRNQISGSEADKATSQTRKAKSPFKRLRTAFLALSLMLLSATAALAHVWEIRVNQNQDGSLTWYMQSYHGLNECGHQNSGIRINGVDYPLQAEFNGSVTGLSNNVFTSIGSMARGSYATVTTPYIAGTLNVTAYSNNACWDGYPGMPLGNQSFNPPPPPVCTSAPVTGWSNTVAATGNNNGTFCNATDDFTTATIKVNHLACASITGDKQFRVIFDPAGANVAYGPFNYATGIETSVTINIPYGTTNATLVKVIDDDFPAQVTHGLSIPNGQYLGEKETVAPSLTTPANITTTNTAGICGAKVTYTVTATDNCSNAVVTQIAGLPSGSSFPLGTTTNTFVATDAAGNTVTQSFNVTVTDTQAPIFAAFGNASGDVVYLRSSAGAPWGQNGNETALNTVFGAGNWKDYRYETVNIASLLSNSTKFIFMEGGDGTANEMKSFLTANLPAIESWVSSGGALFLNAAPNEGGNMNFGFGGVTLV
jgi:hypothetical protein